MVVDLRQLHLSDRENNIVIDQSYISIIGSNSPLIMSVDSDIFLYKFFYLGAFWYNKCSQGLLILNLLFSLFGFFQRGIAFRLLVLRSICIIYTVDKIKKATMNFYDHCCKKSMFPAGIEPTTSA